MAKSSDIIKIGFDYRASLEQFVKETNGVFDGISEKAGKQRISIQLDAKNDKVIEKIKELQKLKLDKFTFEFGESGLAEQLKTFDQLEKKITEIINLSKGINNIGSGNGIGNSIVDEKSLNSIIDLFGKMENHLGEIKRVFADVGDGGEFSPLISTIDKINSSIKELSTSVKGIGLNMNIDVGSDSEAEAKVQSKISNALQAYQRLFEHIKTSSAGGAIINTKFFDFDINQYDTMMGKLQAYRKFIENMRKEVKSQFNGQDILFQDTEKSYWTAASSAMGQVTKAFNEMNASTDTNPLENLFGKTDLTEVITQLNLIVQKLGEISTTASEFKNVFANGFNVSASVEEIEKLTSRVKELEDELSKVKVSSTSPVETNISSGNEVTKQQIDAEVKLNAEIEKREDILRELAQLQEKLTVGEDFHGNDRYFADALPTEKDIRDADARIKKLTGSNNIFDVDKLIEDRNRWLSEVRYSLEEYENLIKKNNQKALDDYTSQGLTRIDGAESFFAFEDNNFSIASRFAEEKSKIEAEIGDLYNNLDKLENKLSESLSATPIKDTFQGDKIQETVNSARELDKTLEQVDIPKDGFDEVINKLKLAEIKAEDIVKITKQMRIGEDGKPIESYTLKDKYGSTEIYGVSSNKEKGQLLSANYVQYDARQAEKLQKDFNKAYEEATKINNALTETKGKLDGLSKHPELSSQFSEVETTIKSLNTQLVQGEISVSEYNKAVKETTSNYSKLVSIQQKRDTETYNANAKQARDEAKALEQAAKQAQKLAEEKRKARQADKQSTQSSVDKALKDQLDAWEAIQKIRLQIAQTDSKDTTKLQNLKTQKKERQEDFIQAQKVLKANEELYDKESQLAKLELERLETNEKINKLKLNNVDIGSVLSKGDSDLKKFESRKNQSEEYRGTVEKLKQSIEELRILEQSMAKSKLLPDGEVQKINEAVTSIEEYTKAIKNMPAVEKGSDENSRNKLTNRIYEYMKKNTRMSKEFREELENIIKILRTGGDSVNIKEMSNHFEDVKIRIKEAKQEGISFFDMFKTKAVYGFAARLAQYYLSFYDFIRYARYAVDALIELDSALLDLQKTTSMTENQLEDFYYTSNDIAKKMGVTTAEIIDQASAWSRLGYSSEEAATKMAQLSSQFASISPGMETDQAQEGLVSIMKAWDIDPDNVKSEIMDNINILGNSFAESNTDLVEGMKRSAAALSAVGTDYKDAFALFTGAQEILQNAEVTGRALRSISMRIRGYSESSEDGFEELDDELKTITGDLIDLTKTAEHSQGVSIFKEGSTTEFKSLVEYFGEISEIWDEMNQVQQNNFLQKAFGKTQANLCLYVQRCA